MGSLPLSVILTDLRCVFILMSTPAHEVHVNRCVYCANTMTLYYSILQCVITYWTGIVKN